MPSNEGLAAGLEWKVVLSAVSDWEDWEGNVGSQSIRINWEDLPDPQAELFGDYVLKDAAGTDYTVSNTDDLGKLEQPNHYHDRLDPKVFDKDARTGSPTSVKRDIEFELDVESLTHTWQGLASPLDMPMMNPFHTEAEDKSVAGAVVFQMNQVTMDLGMSTEIFNIRGTLIDRENPPHQASTGAPHIRKQQLLDIARGQWIGSQGVGSEEKDTSKALNSPNKWVALTIGPASRRTQKDSPANAYSELYWQGTEPSDDIRGKERLRTDSAELTVNNGVNRRALTYSKNRYEAESNLWKDDRVLRDWDYKLHYTGRNRYRGAIKDLTLSNRGGQPDVWTYQFTFTVVTNETQVRMLEVQ